LRPDQQTEIARFQVISRLFDDAAKTITNIENFPLRNETCRFLLQEQIRIHHLDEAKKTLALMPDSPAASACRSMLKIAQEQGSKEDFALLGLPIPTEAANDQDREQCCIGLIQSGFLHLAGKTAEQITDSNKRAGVFRRLGSEFLLIYSACNGMNDPNRQIRQEMERAIETAAEQTGQPDLQTGIMTELLINLAERLQTEADVAAGRKIWQQTILICRQIADPDDQAELFAQLIVAKNLLEKPLRKTTVPFFTKESNESAYTESNQLALDCVEMMNNMKNAQSQGTACAYLARALAQIGRTKSAQTMLNRMEVIADDFADSKEAVPIYLLMVPVLKAINSTGEIPGIYRSAIDAVSKDFTSRIAGVEVYDWRIRDSEIERIIRSQMENGFVDDAVKSVNQLNEPVLRDRLLRAAAYIYLDQGDMEQAEIQSRRLTVKEIQRGTIQNVLFIKRRSERQSLLNTIRP
jgi:tetratricopeptide (TPR) repeat protein